MRTSVEQRLIGEELSVKDALSAWMACGLFEHDLKDPGRFFSAARQAWDEGQLRALLTDLSAAAQGTPDEGEPLTLWGRQRFWCLVRQRGYYLGFGQFTLVPQVSVMLLATDLTVDRAVRSVWRWEVASALRTLVWLDGRLVEGYACGDDRAPMRSDRFRLELEPGRHRLTVALACCRAMQKIASRLVLEEAPAARLQAQVPFKGDLQERLRIERAVTGTRPRTWHVAPGQAVTYVLPAERPPSAEVAFECAGEALNSAGAGEDRLQVTLPPPPVKGELKLTVVWGGRPGGRITHREDTLTVRDDPWSTPVPTTFEERCREVLDAALVAGERSGPWNTAVWDALAWAASKGSQPPDTWLEAAVDWLDERRDCADFTLHGLLRLLWLDDRDTFLSATWRARLRATLLGFCYALEDINPPTMFMGSENHRFLFHSGGWLAGLRYPAAQFTASGLSGHALAARSRMRTLEWLRQRGRFGFSEWHSACYLPVNLYGLLNLCDHLRSYPWLDHTGAPLAENLTDLIFYFLAADHYQGALIGSQGRAYARQLLLPELDGTGALCRLAYGVGPLAVSAGRGAAVSLATSGYRPPDWFTDLARDPAPREARYRQGLTRDGDSVQYSLRRTGDYGLGVIEHGAAGRTPGGCYVRVLLPGGVGVFGSATRVDVISNAFRPDYWSGNETGCTALRRSGTLLLRWDATPEGILTHFYMPMSRFDETARAGEWVLARSGNGWIALTCSASFHLAAEGAFAGEEWVCDQPGACWAIECGGVLEGRPYQEACARLRDTPGPAAASVPATYHSPWAGVMTLPCAETPVTENFAEGAELSGRFGSGELAVRYQGKQKLLWFTL